MYSGWRHYKTMLGELYEGDGFKISQGKEKSQHFKWRPLKPFGTESSNYVTDPSFTEISRKAALTSVGFRSGPS